MRTATIPAPVKYEDSTLVVESATAAHRVSGRRTGACEAVLNRGAVTGDLSVAIVISREHDPDQTVRNLPDEDAVQYSGHCRPARTGVGHQRLGHRELRNRCRGTG